jgi:protein-tyrosine phosphatase
MTTSSIDHIVDNIYISDFHSASLVGQAFPTLYVIINVSKEDHNRTKLHPLTTYHFLPIEDSSSQELISSCAFPVYQIMKQIPATTNILVHCQAGISRSVSCVLFYLMKTKDIRYRDALRIAQTARACAMPNFGFEEQLKMVDELKVISLDNIKLIYNVLAGKTLGGFCVLRVESKTVTIIKVEPVEPETTRNLTKNELVSIQALVWKEFFRFGYKVDETQFIFEMCLANVK